MITKKYLDDLTYEVIGCAIYIHKSLGPGLLESVYHKCFEKELDFRNLRFKSEHRIPILYRDKELEVYLKSDLVIENCLCVELKAIDCILPIHQAQLMTYMKILNVAKGVLINFNVTNIFKYGQKTFVNEYYSMLKEK